MIESKENERRNKNGHKVEKVGGGLAITTIVLPNYYHLKLPKKGMLFWGKNKKASK